MYNSRLLQDLVIDKNLCTLCGTCMGVCQQDVFAFAERELKVTHSECVNCGKCVETCPGGNFDFPFFREYLAQGQSGVIPDHEIGFYRSIWRGQATETDIRDAGASGGVVSALLIHLLRGKNIQGAIVIDYVDPRQPIVKIAVTEAEIIKAAQSKYTFVPTNLILGQLRRLPGRYAYVGLPCQVQGLRKAMLNDQSLAEKICIIIGLYCGFNMYADATKYLVRKSKIPFENIVKLEYRAKQGQDTGFCVTAQDGIKWFVPKHEYTFLNLIYTNDRCLKCYDLTSEFSDISVGDAWEKPGWARCIARTEKGQHILEDAQKDILVLETSSKSDIEATQIHLLHQKKRNIAQKKRLSRFFPEYGETLIAPIGMRKVRATLFYLFTAPPITLLYRGLLWIVPFCLLRRVSFASRQIIQSSQGKETLRYIIYGILAVIFNFVLFGVLSVSGIDYKTNNLIAIIATKLFIYTTNKFLVFKTKSDSIAALMREITRFTLARLGSGLVEFIGLIAIVELLGITAVLGKLLMIVITTILNYVLSKKMVFGHTS